MGGRLWCTIRPEVRHSLTADRKFHTLHPLRSPGYAKHNPESVRLNEIPCFADKVSRPGFATSTVLMRQNAPVALDFAWACAEL